MMCSRPARDAPTSTAWPATCIRVRPPPPRGPSRAPSKRQHARSAHMLQRKGSGSGSGGGTLAAACLLLSGRLGSYSPMSRARRVMLWGGRARSVTCMAGGRLSAPHFFFFSIGLRKKRPSVGRKRHRPVPAGICGKSRSFAFARKFAPKILLHALAGSPLASIKRGSSLCAAVAQVAVARLIGGIGYKQRLARKIIDAMSAKSEWRLVPFQPHRKTVAN